MADALEQRALNAACAVAVDCGVACEQAEILSAASNVLIHLRPSPVVARVMTGTVALHDDPRRWLGREIAVMRFLEPTGLAVAASPEIDPGPVCRDGLWMTFCAFVDHEGGAGLQDGPERLARALRELHVALAPFPGELGNAAEVRDDIERLRRRLRPSPVLTAAHIVTLGDRLDAVSDSVFAAPLPIQALHGDISHSNFLRAGGRLVVNDFEDTFRGPLHWDVASLVESLRIRRAGAAGIARALDAYGWTDPDGLAPFIAAQEAYGEIWQAYDAQRRI